MKHLRWLVILSAFLSGCAAFDQTISSDNEVKEVHLTIFFVLEHELERLCGPNKNACASVSSQSLPYAAMRLVRSPHYRGKTVFKLDVRPNWLTEQEVRDKCRGALYCADINQKAINPLVVIYAQKPRKFNDAERTIPLGRIILGAIGLTAYELSHFETVGHELMHALGMDHFR